MQAKAKLKVEDLLDPIWERQPREKNLWFDRFTKFLLIGPGRNLRKAFVAEHPEYANRPSASIPINASWGDQAYTWSWKARAEAWDAKQRQILLDREQDSRATMLEKHIKASQAWQNKALQALLSQENPLHVDDIGTALRMWVAGVTEERKARGMPSQQIEIEQMTDDQLLSRYSALLGRLADVQTED